MKATNIFDFAGNYPTEIFLTQEHGKFKIILCHNQKQIEIKNISRLEIIDARPEIKLPTPILPTQELLPEPVANKKVTIDKWGDL